VIIFLSLLTAGKNNKGEAAGAVPAGGRKQKNFDLIFLPI